MACDAVILPRAIESVLAQSHSCIEILVVDDGSTDSTQDLLRRYIGRVEVIRQKNGGVAEARNAGIRSANGEFVAFLDSDDEWMPTKLAKQLKIFEKYPNVGLVCGGMRDILPDGMTRVVRHRTLRGNLFKTLLKYNPVRTSTVVVRRANLEAVIPCFVSSFPVSEDWQLWMRLAARCEFVVMSDILGSRFIGQDNLSSVPYDQEFCLTLLRGIYESLFSDEAVTAILGNERNFIEGNICMSAAEYYYSQSQSNMARKEVLKALWHSPLGIDWVRAFTYLTLPPRYRNKIKRMLFRSA